MVPGPMVGRLQLVTPESDRDVEGERQPCRAFPTIGVKWAPRCPPSTVVLDCAEWDEMVEEIRYTSVVLPSAVGIL